MKEFSENRSFFKRIILFLEKLSYIYILLVFLIILGCAIYFVFIRTPDFLFLVKNKLVHDSNLMKSIGGEEGYQIYYTGKSQRKKKFFVKINGKCPGASLTVHGVYTDRDYTINDTVLVKCK